MRRLREGSPGGTGPPHTTTQLGPHGGLELAASWVGNSRPAHLPSRQLRSVSNYPGAPGLPAAARVWPRAPPLAAAIARPSQRLPRLEARGIPPRRCPHSIGAKEPFQQRGRRLARQSPLRIFLETRQETNPRTRRGIQDRAQIQSVARPVVSTPCQSTGRATITTTCQQTGCLHSARFFGRWATRRGLSILPNVTRSRGVRLRDSSGLGFGASASLSGCVCVVEDVGFAAEDRALWSRLGDGASGHSMMRPWRTPRVTASVRLEAFSF